MRRNVRTTDLEILISGFSDTHSTLQRMKCDILTSLWHSFFSPDFNIHTKKHLYKSVIFSLCNFLKSLAINNKLKPRLLYLKENHRIALVEETFKIIDSNH